MATTGTTLMGAGTGIRVRLSVMMFLEFMIWASWYVPIGGYMNSTLHFTGGQIGWIYTTTALGAIIAPLFVGFVADRFFPTQVVLGVLHLAGAVFLLLASFQTTFLPLMVLLLLHCLCFMPTLALANSLGLRNIDDRDKFSRITVWGTIGWIVSGLLVSFLLGGETKPNFFYLGTLGGVLMGLYCFTLPHTPPKGAEGEIDVLGLGAAKLLSDPSFLIFSLSVFLISIPLTCYFTWMNAFLVETDRPRPTALMTLAQCSEIVVMYIMPWFINQIGLKNVLLIGMIAWVVRYLLFATVSFPLIILGLLLHGFCYSFVFVASFIYADRKAPPGLSASVQSFLAFLMWGLGMFVGAKLAGWVGDMYGPTTLLATIQKGDNPPQEERLPLPKWEQMLAAQMPRSVPLDSSMPGTKVAIIDAGGPKIALVEKLNVWWTLPPDYIVEEKDPEGKSVQKTIFPADKLLDVFKEADANEDGVVTHEEWQLVAIHRWPPIWLWPALLAAVVVVLFWVGGQEAPPAAASAQSAPSASSQPGATEPTQPSSTGPSAVPQQPGGPTSPPTPGGSGLTQPEIF
ncbi:MAG: MFS transporter [Thermoguttaceae bacterium]|nr:MFS transporter [Thermoguttaceae bacterium]MDW8038992.1 MFS transporter [Thermoguttaceae bacterium]